MRFSVLLVGGFAAGFALLAAGVARADDPDCVEYNPANEEPTQGPKFTLGAIGPKVARSYFIRNGSEKKGCPSPSAECRGRSFLVSGDEIALGRTNGPFVCAHFVGKLDSHSGWVLAADVVPSGPVALADWVGSWKIPPREGDATITIKLATKPGALSIKGNATWSGMNPPVTNTGEIEAVVVPDGANLSLTMGDGDQTLPVDQGEGCKVWMGRGARRLLVFNNFQCGGMNVTFSGVYTRH